MFEPGTNQRPVFFHFDFHFDFRFCLDMPLHRYSKFWNSENTETKYRNSIIWNTGNTETIPCLVV